MPAKKAKIQRLLTEERFAFTGGAVDRTDPTHPKIIGALLCGPESGNQSIGTGRDRIEAKGRRYLPKAFSGKRVERYNGSLVFLNHPSKVTDNRIYQDKIATVENARHRADGMPIGDLAVNPKNPHAEQFLWDAEHAPNSCGMSHRAYCDWQMSKDGFAEAVELQEVLSVDVVIGPATTGGVFEHKETPMPMKLSVVAEWLTKHPKSTVAQCLRMKTLVQEDGEVEMAAPADDADPEATIDEAFEALMTAHMREMISGSSTLEEFIKKIKALYKAHKGEAKEEGGEKKEPKEDEPKEPKEESKRIGYDKALSLCSEAKYTASPNEYRLLAKCGTDAEAKAFIAEQSAKAGDVKPRSSGRTQANPPKTDPVQESRTIPAWNRQPSRS